MKIYKNLERLLFKRFRHQSMVILLVISGLVCGLFESAFNAPYVAFVFYAPLIYSLCTAGSDIRSFAGRFVSFFFPYYAVSLVCLLNIISVCPLSLVWSVLLLVGAWLLMSLWETVIMFCSVAFFRNIKTGKVYDVFSLSLLICGGEWLSEHICFLPFPWAAAWLSVTNSPFLMKPASLLGCRFVSFFVLSCGGLLGFALMSKNRKKYIACLCGAVLMWTCVSVTADKISSDKQKENVTVSCVQSACYEKDKRTLDGAEMVKKYVTLLEKDKNFHSDFVLLPETAVPEDFDEKGEAFVMLSDFAKKHNCTVVTGAFYIKDGSEYNAMTAVTPDGKFSAPYFKQVLMPFGEKIPFAFLFGITTLSEGHDRCTECPLQAGKYVVGASVCVESLYSSLMTKQSKSGANVLCVSTNDSWFIGTSARQRHFRQSIMRAVENGKYLLRAGNCGISAVISPSGKVLSSTADCAESVLTDSISLVTDKTLYTSVGDIFMILPAMLIIVSLISLCQHRTKNA